uniref:Uncharacterized protein n=1 Tax=Rhizophora mucronata TaxID=61149 RepID=A0A2P2PFA3_RHIMU
MVCSECIWQSLILFFMFTPFP